MSLGAVAFRHHHLLFVVVVLFVTPPATSNLDRVHPSSSETTLILAVYESQWHTRAQAAMHQFSALTLLWFQNPSCMQMQKARPKRCALKPTGSNCLAYCCSLDLFGALSCFPFPTGSATCKHRIKSLAERQLDTTIVSD